MRVMIADRDTGEPMSLGAALLAGKKVGADVTRLLEEDHRTVLGWFAWYGEATDEETKTDVARSICKALRAHMAAEEEIFYPAAKLQTRDEALVQHALDEHEGAKRLLDKIENTRTAARTRADAMRELGAEVAAHVEEEETKLFPQVRNSGMNLYAVGRGVAARRVDRLFELTGSGRAKKAARSRQRAKTVKGSQLKEFPVMQISQDEAREYYVTGLKNAHAAVKEGRTMVEAQLDRLEQYPKLEAKLEAHLKEKDQQLKRLEKLLERSGEKPSALKDTAMKVMGGMGSMANAAAADEVIRNSFATLGLAKFEAASFETLILFGEAAGEREALPPLQQCLSEERAMASFIEENLRETGMRFLQLKSEGAQASH